MTPDLASPRANALLLDQRITYSYERPIRLLSHRLVVIPRAVHGVQVRNNFGVSVSDRSAKITLGTDTFANCVARVDVGAVSSHIEFSAWAVVTRSEAHSSLEPHHVAEDRRFRAPSSLTAPTPQIAEIGRELAAAGSSPCEIGEMACRWTSQAISYGHDATDVHTTAGAALAGGIGVCQDYAHVMLAVCRAAGVSARYVSGHLTGEGGSHAWVEILERGSFDESTRVIGFDPTHDRRTDTRYLTVAIGRDYNDVAPTSGTFEGRAHGRLHVRKRVHSVLTSDDFEPLSVQLPESLLPPTRGLEGFCEESPSSLVTLVDPESRRVPTR